MRIIEKVDIEKSPLFVELFDGDGSVFFLDDLLVLVDCCFDGGFDFLEFAVTRYADGDIVSDQFFVTKSLDGCVDQYHIGDDGGSLVKAFDDGVSNIDGLYSAKNIDISHDLYDVSKRVFGISEEHGASKHVTKYLLHGVADGESESSHQQGDIDSECVD